MAEQIGKYEVLDLIGRGGMGAVYRARDPILNRLVAIKVISPEVEPGLDMSARFFDEAKACAGLSHPNIVTVYDVGEDQGRRFLVMELLDGESLKQLIANGFKATIEAKLSIAIRLCDALSYAHAKGVIHRDIKPANILIQTGGVAKIIDFGIAKMATSSSLTRTGLIMGTLRYMSPEQVRNKADQRSDQYSIAAVFYEMLCLRSAFQADDPIQLLEMLRTDTPPSLVEIDPRIPPELAAIVERGMSKDPESRYPDMRAMRDEFESVQRWMEEESHRLRVRLKPAIQELRSLDAVVAGRLGGPTGLDLLHGDGPGMSLEALRASDQQLVTARDWLRGLTGKLDKAEPRLIEANTLAGASSWQQARPLFESILAEIPEFVSARESFAKMEEVEGAARRQELVRDLVERAKSSLEKDDATASLALLRELAELGAPPERAEEIANLTASANSMVSQHESKRRATEEVDRTRASMEAFRDTATKVDGATRAAQAWGEAEALRQRAETLHQAKEFTDAAAAFEAAGRSYGSVVSMVNEMDERERREREAIELAERTRQGRELLDRARACMAGGDLVRCFEVLLELESLPPPDSIQGDFASLRAEAEANLSRERQARKPAQDARVLMAKARAEAEVADADKSALAAWQSAETSAIDGTSAFQREQFSEAREAFASATRFYQSAVAQSRDPNLKAKSEPQSSATPPPNLATAGGQTNTLPKKVAEPGDDVSGDTTVFRLPTAPGTPIADAKKIKEPDSHHEDPTAGRETVDRSGGAGRFLKGAVAIGGLAIALAVIVRFVPGAFDGRKEIDSTPPPPVAAEAKAEIAAAAAVPESAVVGLEENAERDVRTLFAAAERKRAEAEQARRDGDFARAETLYTESREAFEAIAKSAAPETAPAGPAEGLESADERPAQAEAKEREAQDREAQDREAQQKSATQAAAKARQDQEAKEKAATAAAKARQEREAKESALAKAATKSQQEQEAKKRAEATAKAEVAATKPRDAEAQQRPQDEKDSGAQRASLLTKSWASIYTQPTDGRRKGGSWGVCWRVDAGAARACAKANCDRTKKSTGPCSEIASSAPGGHCAVARADGFGVSWGACGSSVQEASSSAAAGCVNQVRRTYSEKTNCTVIWTSAR